MARSRLWSKLFCRKSSRYSSPQGRARLGLESLEDRTLPSVSLLFDPLAGNLSLVGDAGSSTVRESLSPAGFLEVAVDGQWHSSDPAAAFFDPSLAGAAAATLRGIRFDGGAQDTLILGSQKLVGSLGVVSGATLSVEGAIHASALSLAGAGGVAIEVGGVLAATRIDVSASVFVNSGQVRAEGLTGGEVIVSAGNVLNGGHISADGSTGGGLVRVAFTGAYEDTSAAVTSADGSDGPGGRVVLDGGAVGHLFSSGRHQATGSAGGTVELFAQEIDLVGATLDASGQAGGGVLRVGGDFHGGYATVTPHNAQTVFAAAGTTLRADALGLGGGGNVAVWADGDTTFGGTVTARGGPGGGNGGFVEVSGAGNLDYGGAADTSAPAGKAGTLLLDPKNLVIDSSVGALPQFNFVDPHPSAGGRFGTNVSVLSGGNVVVANPYDNFGGNNAGAVYLFDGLTGVLISSLAGSNANDQVGNNGVTALSNGNYVVRSPSWNGNRGAATWGSGAGGVSGVVSAANSLTGSNPNDFVGYGGVKVLSNGNYVVQSPRWNGNRGAATWGSGTAGVSGTVSAANSLTGSNPNDYVGDPRVTALSNGNYVVGSSSWNGFRGAATWGSGTSGVSGAVSAANSLTGSNPNDSVGGEVTALGNGNYVIRSASWNGRRGAATWASGTNGQTLDGNSTITPQNSLLGQNAFAGLGGVLDDPSHQAFVGSFSSDGTGRVLSGFVLPNQLTYARGQSQTVTITPALLARTLNTGGAVVLQASNDITINSPITVSAGGSGGSLTLQAGRSILIDASITTDNGPLTLIANDQLVNGVVDAQRDPGNAVLTVASETTLNTGSGTLTVQLRDGAGLTNADSGAVTLQPVTAGSVAVANNGPDAGSDVVLRSVTTAGPQSYANPNGTTLVTGNLAAGGNAVTFNDAVEVFAGVTVGGGADVFTFNGTVAPDPGLVSVAGSLTFSGAATFSATLNGSDPASYSQVAASGPVDLGGSTLSMTLGYTPQVGDSFTLLSSGSGPITGTFAGLDEGAIFSQGGFTFQITYQGGPDGNSVVLTCIA